MTVLKVQLLTDCWLITEAQGKHWQSEPALLILNCFLNLLTRNYDITDDINQTPCRIFMIAMLAGNHDDQNRQKKKLFTHLIYSVGRSVTKHNQLC